MSSVSPEATEADFIAPAELSDSDGDGVSNSDDNCPAWAATANDEDPDPWPIDFNDDQVVNINDLLPGFKQSYAAVSPHPRYHPRYDLHQDGAINVNDLLPQFKSSFNRGCSP